MATPSLVKNVKHTMFTTSETVRRPLQESYEVGPEIGRGSYGSVFSATHKETRLVYAVKVIQKDKVVLLLLLLLLLFTLFISRLTRGSTDSWITNWIF